MKFAGNSVLDPIKKNRINQQVESPVNNDKNTLKIRDLI